MAFLFPAAGYAWLCIGFCARQLARDSSSFKCTVLDQLMLVVSGYRSGWTPEQLSRPPVNVAQLIASSEDLVARAVEASRAEVQFNGPADQYALLREMALTLTFAATRLRYLQALRASGPL